MMRSPHGGFARDSGNHGSNIILPPALVMRFPAIRIEELHLIEFLQLGLHTPSTGFIRGRRPILEHPRLRVIPYSLHGFSFSNPAASHFNGLCKKNFKLLLPGNRLFLQRLVRLVAIHHLLFLLALFGRCLNS